MTLDPEILAVLRRLLAERANRDPESITAKTALAELLVTQDAWIAVQRAIFMMLNCAIRLGELKTLHTVDDLALAVAVRMAGAPSLPS